MDKKSDATIPPSLERIMRLLLAIASVSVFTSVLLAVLWWRAAHDRVHPEDLTATEREELAGEMLAASPGVHSWPW